MQTISLILVFLLAIGIVFALSPIGGMILISLLIIGVTRKPKKRKRF